MTPSATLALRDSIMSAWRAERDPERKATLLEWADAVGTAARMWAADRTRLDNMRREAFAAAPRVPAGGFGASRGVLRDLPQVGNVVSLRAAMIATQGDVR